MYQKSLITDYGYVSETKNCGQRELNRSDDLEKKGTI